MQRSLLIKGLWRGGLRKVANKIFVVEDDISICEMVDNYLVSEDFRVNVFHSGFEAIRAFQLNTDSTEAIATSNISVSGSLVVSD